MVLYNELGRHGCAETQREGRGLVELLIRENSHRSGSLAAVLPQELKRGRLRNLSIVLSMFGIHLCDDLPSDLGYGLATGHRSRDINLDWIHAGHVVNYDADRAPVPG